MHSGGSAAVNTPPSENTSMPRAYLRSPKKYARGAPKFDKRLSVCLLRRQEFLRPFLQGCALFRGKTVDIVAGLEPFQRVTQH